MRVKSPCFGGEFSFFLAFRRCLGGRSSISGVSLSFTGFSGGAVKFLF